MRPPSLPSAALLHEQAQWLAPARARLLRRVHVARRRRVLDLACGSGAVTGELVRRAGGPVVALDSSREALAAFEGAGRLCADAARLPFADATFDLVFCQFALPWLPAAAVAGEVHRVLEPGGVWILLEPDYGGMIEYPPDGATRDLWLSALARAGADPEIGRKLPSLLTSTGFQVRVDLLDHLAPPSPARFTLLRELPLCEAEAATLRRAEAASRESTTSVGHLPLFLVTAEKAVRRE